MSLGLERALPRRLAIRRLKWTSNGITINDPAAMTIPTVECSGARRSSSARTAS